MTEQQRRIMAHWYAYIYEQQEDEHELIACVKQMLGDAPLRILEPACDDGKLCVPPAQAGHDVTGFAMDEAMLQFAYAKAEHLPNLHIQQADMLATNWWHGFDAVLLCANLMVNIQTDWDDYKQAQKKLLDNARNALRPGGHLLLTLTARIRSKRSVARVNGFVLKAVMTRAPMVATSSFPARSTHRRGR